MPVRRLLLPILLCLPSAARAEAPGYVVRVDSSAVYLDFGKDSGAAPGRGFLIYKEGEELRHPVTGASLGRVEETVAEGRITEVRDSYSIGVLFSSPGTPSPGRRVRLGPPSQPAAVAAPAPSTQTSAPDSRLLRRSPPLDIEAVDLAVGDLDGDGEPELILAGKDSVQAYSMKDGDPRPLALYKDSATAVQFLSLDAADLDKDGRAEVFVSLHNRFFGRLESSVLVLSSGSLTRKTSLPWLVRRFHDSSGASLAAQQVLSDSAFPFSSIRRLGFSDGRYTLTDPPLKIRRLDWLYGFGLSRRSQDAVALLPNPAQRLRLQFPGGSWTSPESYAQTSNRARWQERTLLFHPRLVVEEGPEGLLGVYVLRAIPRFGVLAESQGLYSKSELHYLRFNGSALEPAWKAELPGYASGLAELAGGPGREAALLAAVVSSEGKTAVWAFRR